MLAFLPQLGARLTHSLERVRGLLPLGARITAGWVFLESGLGKLRHLQAVTEFLHGLGFPDSLALAGFLASLEALGGTLLLAGLLTRLSALPLMAIMAMALMSARRPELEGLSDLLTSPEWLLGLLLAWLLVDGPGPVSLDHVLFRKWKRLE